MPRADHHAGLDVVAAWGKSWLSRRMAAMRAEACRVSIGVVGAAHPVIGGPVGQHFGDRVEDALPVGADQALPSRPPPPRGVPSRSA